MVSKTSNVFQLLPKSLQHRCHKWLLSCLGEKLVYDLQERRQRFLEEALELCQATDGTADEAHALVDYVYGRKVGEIRQEVGGVVLTLSALCTAHEIDFLQSAEDELVRVHQFTDVIRAKQLKKPVINLSSLRI